MFSFLLRRLRDLCGYFAFRHCDFVLVVEEYEQLAEFERISPSKSMFSIEDFQNLFVYEVTSELRLNDQNFENLASTGMDVNANTVYC